MAKSEQVIDSIGRRVILVFGIPIVVYCDNGQHFTCIESVEFFIH